MGNTTDAKHPVALSGWYEAAMEQLVSVVQELSQARDLEAVMAITREAARELTRADGATFVLRDGDQCFYADESAISPLWKGCRFPMSACISGWVMLNARCAVIEDIYADPRIPADAYRPTFVKSLAMVPIRRSEPIGAIGNYWATRRLPTQKEVAILQALADTTSVALENVKLYEDLQQRVDILKEREAHIWKQRSSLEVFTRALAHDLKEPVRAIQSFSRLMDQGETPADKSQQYFGYIRDAAERMGILIEAVSHYIQLDDFAGAARSSCSMEAVLGAAMDRLAPLIGESGAVVSHDALPELRADSDGMRQVMHHLLSNSIRHGGKGVAIHIGAEDMPDQWRFSFQDNGPGIPSVYRERIFSPFKRLESEKNSVGLGLAVCRKIIEGHGGKIWCPSRKGPGAVFLFTLPKVPRPAQAQSSGASLANILLVDDTESDIELAQILLLNRDILQCDLLIARTGKEALDMLKKSVLYGPAIDLTLLDINMPGMDGFELLETIRGDETMKHLQVVMFTGSTYEKDIQRAQSFGVAGYLVKPPSFDELKSILDRIPTLSLRQENGSCRLMRAV
jgi:signal transduction histidine kinase/ActR/RegA family two-component response regulator